MRHRDRLRTTGDLGGQSLRLFGIFNISGTAAGSGRRRIGAILLLRIEADAIRKVAEKFLDINVTNQRVTAHDSISPTSRSGIITTSGIALRTTIVVGAVVRSRHNVTGPK
jgi:hypothetical protein